MRAGGRGAHTGCARFIAKKWTSEKRFGLEGAEALIPGLQALIDEAATLGTKSIVLGMPHRGRLNVLANVMRKPAEVRGRHCLASTGPWPESNATPSPSRGGGGDKTALSDAPTVRQAIFYEFSGKYDEGDSFSGDVKYHLGMSIDRPTQSGKQVRHRAC